MQYQFCILLLLIPLFYAAKPSVKNALKHQVLIDLKNHLVPIISAKIQHMHFNDIHSSHSGVKITVSKIMVHINPIHPNQINIGFHGGSSTTEISGAGFGMKGTAHIKAKILIITKSFNGDVTINNAGVGLKFSLLTANGRLNARVDHVAIHVSGNNVHIHLHGDIIVKILNFVVNLLKGHLVSNIVKQMQNSLPKTLTDIINKLLNSLPRDLAVGKQLMIRYEFPYPPRHANGYMYTGIYGYIYLKGSPAPPPYEPIDIPEYNPALPRGIQFFFTEFVMQSALDALFKAGLMKIAITKSIIGHPMKIAGKAVSSPVFKLPNAIYADIQGSADVYIDNSPDKLIQIVCVLHMHCDEYIKNNILFFHINKGEIKSIQYIVPKPFDIEFFKQGINEVLAVVVAEINADLGDKGIPIPTVAEVEFRDLAQNIKNGYLEIGFNPVFHIKSEEMNEKEESEVVAEENQGGMDIKNT